MPTEPKPTPPAPVRLKALIVDDNQDAAGSTAEVLPACGAETQACFRGAAALEWFAPEACVLDLSMPGMDGFELAARVRAASPGTPLVALTALSDAGTRARETAAGFDAHFTKPADPVELLRALADLVARRRAGAAPVGS